MAAVVIRSAADVPRTVCGLLGFVPTDSVVVLGLGPITPAARFDIGHDMLASAHEVVERFRRHSVTQGILAIFTDREPNVLVEIMTELFEVLGFDLLDVVTADGERVTGRDGEPMPYLVEALGTREEFARSHGFDPGEAFVVGTEPEVPRL
ncbi:DUF4192 family protein [Nocardioides sp. W3-2-3]|uniref:DUF4192 family protein n=1 Tax=Nocardioides convexus TaxID=2712224 RepID=UPI00241864CB|nr:DUF4192 family protein [Nocardioides convexus]NHA00338.1 DUF4192 family protein [Nocardioides convexus]